MFEKILGAFETGGLTYDDTLRELKRLLQTGAPTPPLAEILRRRELVEPLPPHAHQEILGLLNDALDRAAAQAAAPSGQGAASNGAPAPVSLYEKVLRVFESSGFTNTDVPAQLKQLLLVTGASPAALLNILRRRRLIDALPPHAHQEILDLLNDVQDPATAQAIASADARSAAADIAPVRPPPRTEDPASASTKALTSVFEKVLSVFETSGFTDTDVLAQLKRLLLATGASPRVLLDLLRRRQLVDPLPEYAHARVLGLLKEVIERGAAPAQSPEAGIAPTLFTPMVRPKATATPGWTRGPTIGQTAQVSTRAPPLDPGPPKAETSSSISTQVTASPPPRSPAVQQSAAEPPIPVPPPAPIEAAVPRSSSTPASVSARSAAIAAIRRLLQHSAPVKPGSAAQPSVSAPPRASTPKPAPAATVIPPVAAEVPEEEVTINLDELARVDPVAKREIPVPKRAPRAELVAESLSLKRGGAWPRRAPAFGLGAAAILVLAVTAWFFTHHAPAPVQAQAPAPAPAVLPAPGTVLRECAVCPPMTVLPAGRFKQGSAAESGSTSYEKPLHWVNIGRSFAMSTNAVTVNEFQQFIAATGRDMQGCDIYDGGWVHRNKNSWKNPGFAQTGAHPVTCASWSDAQAYAQWISAKIGHRYRLPSASEWEFAARAGGEAVQPWSSSGSDACANANVADQSAAHRYPGWSVFGCKDGYIYTAPVGSFKTNAFGLNDMLGNVLQWTQDCWNANYAGAPIDGSARADGNCAERELRGGSWFSNPAYVRANYRNHFAAGYRTSTVGIRLVRELEQ